MLLICRFIYSRRNVHSNSSSRFLISLSLFVLCLPSLIFNKFNLKIWAFLQTLIQCLIFVNNLTIFHYTSLFEVVHFPSHSGLRKFLLIFLSSVTSQNEICTKGHRLRKTLQEIAEIFQDKAPLFHKDFHSKGPWLIQVFQIYCIYSL